MELGRGILSFLSNKRRKEREKLFLENGSVLLEALIVSCNGRCDIPIRNFSAKELIKATLNFKECLFSCSVYKGYFEGRPIMTKYFWHFNHFTGSLYSDCINDIVYTSQMSHHKNVLKLLGCCLEFKVPALVYEYAGNCYLSYFLHGRCQNDISLSWKSRLRISKDIANTVVYLHSAFSTPIIYNNLAAGNVIIDQSGVAKLFDFSLSMPLPPGELQVKVDCVRGKNSILAPEYLMHGILTEKCDVFSFGFLLLQLVTGRKITYSLDYEEIHVYVKERQLNRVVDYEENPVSVEERPLNEVVDPRILAEGGGIEKVQQLQDFVALASRCIKKKPEDRLEMIDVAKELRRIERSVHTTN